MHPIFNIDAFILELTRERWRGLNEMIYCDLLSGPAVRPMCLERILKRPGCEPSANDCHGFTSRAVLVLLDAQRVSEQERLGS